MPSEGVSVQFLDFSMPVSPDMYRKAVFSMHITVTCERIGRLDNGV